MASKPRMIGIDLDGTLLRKDHSVSERNQKAIQRCLEEGILVYLVTGRPYCFAKHLALQIDKRIKVISANGGIYEIGNCRICRYIEAQALLQVIDVLEENQMKAFFKGVHEFYTHEPYDHRFLYDHENASYEQDLKVCSHTELSWDEVRKNAKHIAKVLVYHRDEDALIKARNQIECIQDVEVTDYQRISFDITAYQVNKGNSIRQVLKEHQLQKEDFMAIGDGHNDIAMFQEAGIRVGMENADEDVKKYCTYISKDYMHDGVAHAIDYFLGNKT